MLRRSDERAVAVPFAALPFVGLSLIAAAQRAAGLFPFWGDVWAFGFYIALCAGCMTLGFAAASPSGQSRAVDDVPQPFRLLAFILLLGALVSTVIGFSQVFSVWTHSGWIVRSQDLRRPGGNLGQPNHLAILLEMGVASLVFLYQSRKLGPVATSLLLLMLGAGVAITESRAGVLSLLALLGWWLLKRRAIGDLTPRWMGIGAGVVFAAMFLAWPHLLNAMDLLSYKAEDRMLEGSLRLQVWPQLLEALAARPWTGWGILQVATAHNTVADAYPVSEPYTYSHNLVLDLALWIGVPFALLLLGAVGLWLWRRVRAANRLLPWYGLAVALPLAFHSMLEYPYAYAYFLAPVMFLLGAVEASTGNKPLIRVNAKLLTVVLLMSTAVLAWSVIEYVEIEEDFRVARFEAFHIGSLSPGHQRPKIVLFDQLDVLLDDTRISPEPHMSPQAMQIVKKAALHYPWWGTQYRYAVALALNGNPLEAARQIQIMRRMWGEKAYTELKKQIVGLAATRYPELNQLSLP